MPPISQSLTRPPATPCRHAASIVLVGLRLGCGGFLGLYVTFRCAASPALLAAAEASCKQLLRDSLGGVLAYKLAMPEIGGPP